MKKIGIGLVFLLCVGTFSNCINAGNAVGLGPIGAIYGSSKVGISGGGQGFFGSKEGRACVKRIIFFLAYGDASVPAAAINGNITKISTVDKEQFNILGFYSTLCTIVTGE